MALMVMGCSTSAFMSPFDSRLDTFMRVCAYSEFISRGVFPGEKRMVGHGGVAELRGCLLDARGRLVGEPFAERVRIVLELGVEPDVELIDSCHGRLSFLKRRR